MRFTATLPANENKSSNLHPYHFSPYHGRPSTVPFRYQNYEPKQTAKQSINQSETEKPFDPSPALQKQQRLSLPNPHNFSNTSSDYSREQERLRLPKPIPSAPRPHKRYRISLLHRMAAVCMAIFVAAALLGCLLDRLSHSLDGIETELNRRNSLLQKRTAFTAASANTELPQPSQLRSRRLAATGDKEHHPYQTHIPRTNGFWDNTRHRLYTLYRLANVLSSDNNMGTTAYMMNAATAWKNTRLRRRKRKTAVRVVLHSTAPIQRLIHQYISSAPKPPTIYRAAYNLPSGLKLSPVATGVANPNLDDNSNALKWEKHAMARDQRSVHPSIFSNEIVSSRPHLFPEKTSNLYQNPINNLPVSKFMSHIEVAGRGVIIWDLPRGKSLCRVFQIARLHDGTLLLPKWMKKHEKILSSRCRLNNARYALDPDSINPSNFVDRKVTKNILSNQFQIDNRNVGHDLFGSQPPRQHMPHFLSDIIPPLVATEVLIGSGRGLVPFSTISQGTSSNVFLLPGMANAELNPLLFLNTGTISENPTNWVPSLARFFQHPNVGFTIAPDDNLPNCLKTSKHKCLRLFRSVIMTNLNPYEPYGLFGPDGTNHVWRMNGISREPSWNIPGVRKAPCRLSVVALTRKGSRALLELDKLEKSVKAKFMSAGLDTEFKIIDFRNQSFEKQTNIMQNTNILIASHGAGNTNLVFMKPGGALIEIFPFAYKAGPFDGFAKVFGIEYKTAMSAPQTEVFKSCMFQNERNKFIVKDVFQRWDKAVAAEIISPWIHRLELEKEFGRPGKGDGMTTRTCVRLQQLKFDISAVTQMALDSARSQCRFAFQ